MARTKLDFTAVLVKDGHKVSLACVSAEELATQVASYEAKGYSKA